MKLITILALSVLSSVAVAAPKAERPATADGSLPVVATCRDGKKWHSESQEHRGVCSGHGGVAEWADGAPVKGKGRKSYVD